MDITMPGAPRQSLGQFPPVRTIAVSGQDYPGIRPDMMRFGQGDRVRAGETLFVDRKRPQLAITAPVAGTISAITRGSRRTLDTLLIERDGDDAVDFSNFADDTRALLLAAGLWPSFQTRPFGRIPDPDASPDAIFVTAIDTYPLAADPVVAISLASGSFRRGAAALKHLTNGPVFVCHADGARVVEEHGTCVQVAFSGPHPAGLAGTHIHLLAPVGHGKTAWSIGYQDVIAIGRLIETGRLDGERIVSIAGNGVREPALARVPLGASLDELLDGQTIDGPVRVLDGSILDGREAGFLGRHHLQVTAIAERHGTPTVWEKLFGRVAGAGSAIIPTERFDAVMPLDILPVPLMRALAVGDLETARQLGCLELVEEDVALLSHLCASGTDYGALLREMLDQIEGEA